MQWSWQTAAGAGRWVPEPPVNAAARTVLELAQQPYMQACHNCQQVAGLQHCTMQQADGAILLTYKRPPSMRERSVCSALLCVLLLF